MAVVTAKYPGGHCHNIKFYHDCIECEASESFWRCLVMGQPGEQVSLVVHWPEPDVNKIDKSKNPYWYVESFYKVAEKAIYSSVDQICWRHLEDVEKRDWNLYLHITLPQEGKLYLSTGIPFTLTALEKTCREFAEYRTPLGKTEAGCDIPMFRFGSGKRVIWLQANVHVVETSGCHALMGVMRYLVRHKEDWKDFTFFVIPTVMIDRMIGDMEEPERTEDINRNWGHLTLPENIAIDSYLKKLTADGYEILVMTDMHNGWCRADDSGGNLREYTRGFIEDSYWHRRVRFSRALLRTIDYERPDKIWWSDFAEIKTFFQYGSQNYHALCSTMEFSRFKLWNQEKQCYVPQTQEGLERMGEQYAEFLLHYDYDTVEEFTENDYFGK